MFATIEIDLSVFVLHDGERSIHHGFHAPVVVLFELGIAIDRHEYGRRIGIDHFGSLVTDFRAKLFLLCIQLQ
ncbi:hypothetical protein D3C87_2172490 [compost metagenome]